MSFHWFNDSRGFELLSPNDTVQVNERNQNKIKTKSHHILLFNLAHKQCNDIIKGWRHCLTSQSKGRFFVNNVINVCRRVMSGHGANSIFFNKKNKNWTSRTLATPHLPLRPITSHFCLTPPPIPIKVDVICLSLQKDMETQQFILN